QRLHGDTQQKLTAYTYYGLRWGQCLGALLLPIVARVGERLLTHHSLPGSISGTTTRECATISSPRSS
ncbi:MAG TPA: hypothetical protein VHJ79_08865, partial [Mycobacterium sp.]|nr:hypothetical protein [Mycobacterium sp.]